MELGILQPHVSPNKLNGLRQIYIYLVETTLLSLFLFLEQETDAKMTIEKVQFLNFSCGSSKNPGKTQHSILF